MKQIIRLITIILLVASIAKAQDFVFSPINVLQGLSDNQVRYMLQLPDGRMVFKTSGNINIYDGAHFKYIHQDVNSIYPLNQYDGFYRIYTSGDSILWIKDHHKLMCVDLHTENYQANLDAFFKKNGFNRPIDDFFMDSDQRLWLLSGDKLILKNHTISLNLSSNKGHLQDLASDKDHLYLFYSTGTVVCYNLKTKTRMYALAAYPQNQETTFQRTSLVVKGVDGFYQLRNGSKGGFFFFNIRTRSWKKILETDYRLNTLFVKPDGTSYISCANGIWVINLKSGEKKYIPTLKKIDGSTLDTEISTLFFDQQGGFWLGTANQGLLYHHASRYLFTNVGRSYFAENMARDIVVQAFAEDESGNIYIQCESKIYRYSPAEGKNITLTAIPLSAAPKMALLQFSERAKAGYLENNTTAFLKDTRGWRWTGTADGLKLYEPNTKHKRSFYTTDGLSNNFVHALLEDHNKNIWVTTSSGITKLQIDPSNSRIRFSAFQSDAGTLEGEYTGAAFEATDGTLYFGGINGFSLLKPNQIKQKAISLKPVFTNLFLRGEKVEVDKQYDSQVILPVTAPYTQKITLAYDQNFLTFEFSALNFQNPAQTYYRYQLEGIDHTWRETTNSKENEHTGNNGLLSISYTNLPPGNYKLKIMASGSSRKWSGSVTQINLIIHAPWWKTNVAYTLFTVLAIAVVLAMVYTYFYINRKKLERLHQEEILLLRIRNLIDQQHLLQLEKETHQIQVDSKLSPAEEVHLPNQADASFLARAMEQVEKNLDVPNYSVEQLSRDLFMDRTGLYRKLIALLDKSPSLFIRNIRLKKAADLILEGNYSISEITEKVGFSNASYLSKCFQEVYGCRPSEYAEKVKKST